MTTKLTLSIDSEIIIAAKKHAKERRTSLSQLISNYLQSIGAGIRKNGRAVQLSTRIRQLKGSIRLKQPIADDKKQLRTALRRKHL